MKENDEIERLGRDLSNFAENLRDFAKFKNLEPLTRSILTRFNAIVENKKQSLNNNHEDRLKFFHSVALTPKEKSLITDFVDSFDVTTEALKKSFLIRSI